MRWTKPKYWYDASPRETLETFEHITKSRFFNAWNLYLEKNSSFAELVFEYLWLYRTEKAVKDFLNHSEFPAWLLLRFIYFGYGKQFLIGKFDSSDYFGNLNDLLVSETSLKVLSLSEEMDKDPTLKIHLLANLDPKTWEIYFEMLDENSMSMKALVSIFANLKENEIRKILLNSPTLYMYLRTMILSTSRAHISEQETETTDSLKVILESVFIWEKLAGEIQGSCDLKREKTLPPRKRDNTRMEKILREVKKTPFDQREDVIFYLEKTGIIVDNWEKSLLLSSLRNYARFGSYY